MALSSSTFSDAAGSISDLFNAYGDYEKGRGDLAEAQNYGIAADLANKNAAFTATSTAIKLAQSQRNIYQSLSSTQAEAAGAGLKESGSVKDILADSAQQGELQKQVLQQQGYITEAGYKEQAQSYQNMAAAEREAASASDVAGIGSTVTGVIKGAAALAPLLLL